MKDMMNKIVLNLEDSEEMRDSFLGMEPLSKGVWEIRGTIDEIDEKRVVVSVTDVAEIGVTPPPEDLPDVPEDAPIHKVLGGDTAAENPNP
jgi:hypothetical protein